jgi:hypothetical protein
MSTIVRPCVQSDLTQMQLLRSKQTKHAGGSVDNINYSGLLTQVNLESLCKPNITVGVWVDDKLQCYIVGDSTDKDAWVLSLMIGGGSIKHLHMALDYCLEYMESQNCFEFYYAFPEKWARMYRSFWKSGVDRLRKYQITDLAVVKENVMPNIDRWVWENVLKEYLPAAPLLIRKSTCKK